MSVKDTTALTAEANTNLADNSTQEVTAVDIRGMAINIIDSMYNRLDDPDLAGVGDYGAIYITAGATAQTTNGTADTYDDITGFASNGDSSSGVTPDHTSDRITVPAGTYVATFNCSFSGTASTTFTAEGYDATGTSSLTQCRCSRKVPAGGDTEHFGFSGPFTVSTTSNIKVRIKADGTSKSFTPVEMTLSLVRIS